MRSNPQTVCHERLLERLACPHCRGSLAANQREERLLCARCGAVGRWSLGVPDFLSDRGHLAAAGSGSFDLQKDEEAGAELHARSGGVTFLELEAVAGELRESSEGLDPASRAASRFNSDYAQVRTEIGLRAGEATFNRIEPYLEEIGRPIRSGGTALEAGGGEGLFLPEFSKRFDLVVFLDCSLVNIVLARKLAEECKLENVCFVRADATALPFSSQAFDFVHEDNVIEHVADPTALVSEAIRVTSRSGNYVCLSPNRFSIAPEPHFRLPCFGFFPRALRRPLIYRLRGVRTEAGTDPRSLRQLQTYLKAAGARNIRIFFLPRHLRRTTRNTPLRRLLRGALATPILGALIASTINGPLLGLMPYHVALVPGSE